MGTDDNNRIVGNSEENTILGLDGNDEIFAEVGDDILQGNAGDDTVVGGAGNDTIWGGQGNDLIFGSQGDDWLSGDLGMDTISGGEGADTFVIIPDVANQPDILTDFNASAGDKIQVSPEVSPENLGLEVIDSNGDGEVDATLITISSIEQNSPLAIVLGTVNNQGETTLALDDFISISDNVILPRTTTFSIPSLIIATNNDDNIQGNPDADRIFGLAGNDNLSGESGDDFILGNVGNDTLKGGEGNDTIQGGQGDDSLTGDSGDDQLWGDIGNDILIGGEGADTFALTLEDFERVDVIVDFEVSAGDKILLPSDILLTNIALNPVDSNDDGIIDATAIQLNVSQDELILGVALGTVDSLDQTTLTFADFVVT